MCGIVGFLDKTGNQAAPIGRTLLGMLTALGCRGPDSTGVAIFGSGDDGLILQVKLGEHGDFGTKAKALLKRVEATVPVRRHAVTSAYLRLVVDADTPPKALVKAIEEEDAEEIEVVSMGRRLEILKQVGSPEELEATFDISRFVGTHGIGHTRLSTESRVDLSHSQPFWAHGMPDVATAHNGHITNYHKLRRIYEQRGIRFYTENDSEIIAVYLRERIEQGDSLEDAMRASMTDFDGSFCYVAATERELGFIKDPFGLKPLVVAETADWVAVATEEIALRQALGNNFEAREPGTRSLRVWRLPEMAAARTGARAQAERIPA